MRKVLFSMCAAFAAFSCSGLVGGNDEGLPPMGSSGEYSYYNPGNVTITRGSLTDYRDGKTYGTVKIGSQTWMSENLNYNASGSMCYDNQESYCSQYGRLYNGNAAMSACPSGWHLPTKNEWDALTSYVESDRNCYSCDAKHLKAASGWDDNGNGLDTYGFAGLPSGGGYDDGGFYNGGGAYWWSATEYDASNAYYRIIYYYSERARWYYYDKAYIWFSVRCVQD